MATQQVDVDPRVGDFIQRNRQKPKQNESENKDLGK